MSTTVLFVYGTLKRGGRNHAFLAGQEFLGEARTLPHYRLFDAGAYPCLVEDRQAGVAVRGEAWRVDDGVFLRLDPFEEVDHLFRRGSVWLDGRPEPAQTYFYAGDISGMRNAGDAWTES